MTELVGLSPQEVELRRKRSEANRVRSDSSRSYRDILFTNFFNPINALLFSIRVIQIAMGR